MLALQSENSDVAELPARRDASTSNGKFKLLPFSEILFRRENQQLIKGVLPKEGFGLLWGPPKLGKTFVAIDLAMHVATGTDYYGRKCLQGPVVYIACEGLGGLQNRVAAYREHYLSPPETPFYLLATNLNLPREYQQLLNEVRRQEVSPQLIVVDTLARTFDGSESSDVDASAYISAADALWRTFGCLVLVVHHCGHNEERPRGHSSLIGAVDVQLKLTGDDKFHSLVMEVEKMKDGDSGEYVNLQLNSIEIGRDEDGEPVKSLYATAYQSLFDKPLNSLPGASRSGDPTGEKQSVQIAMDALKVALEKHGIAPPSELGLNDEVSRVVDEKSWKAVACDAGISKTPTDAAKRMAFGRAQTQLKSTNRVAGKGGYYWLSPNK